MNSDVRIPPTELRDFLKSQGWTVLKEALADRLYVFFNPAYPRRQLAFPMDMSTPDYDEAVDNAIRKLAELTGTSHPGLLQRICAAGSDVLKLRVHFEGNDSVLPLGFASLLVQNTEKLLRTAACTVLKPRLHHPRLALNEANQLISQARFAQTERGSFVLRVGCPIFAMEGSQGLFDGHQPFVRQVMYALHQGLSQLTTAIETDTMASLASALKNSEKPLLSTNLCDAVADMYDETIRNSLDLGFDWSILRPPPDDVGRRPIIFQRDYFPRIEELRRELRNFEAAQDEVFIGTVERLEGEMGDDGRRSGNVVLALLLPDGGETVRARMLLDADDYDKAYRAHKSNGAYVRVVGRLMPGRQPRLLTQVSAFELLSGSTGA